MVLNVEPSFAEFPATGGSSVFKILNASANRHAFKIKTSNNAVYRVHPVFGFIEPSASADLTIQRLDGPAKEDKLVVQWPKCLLRKRIPRRPSRQEHRLERLCCRSRLHKRKRKWEQVKACDGCVLGNRKNKGY